MYVPPKGFFTKLVEAAALFAIAAWLVRVGVLLIQEVWVWLIVLAGVVLVIRALWKLYKHHKDTHGF